jgi:integral membrane protein
VSDTSPAIDPKADAVGSTPETAPAPVVPTDDHGRVKALAALGRYRVMAWVTGTMLLLLCLEVVLHYVVGVSDTSMGAFHYVPIVHGWIYIVYLAAVADLWSKMHWGLGRLAALAAAGVVPVMSFILERRVHADTLEQLERRSAPREPNW